MLPATTAACAVTTTTTMMMMMMMMMTTTEAATITKGPLKECRKSSDGASCIVPLRLDPSSLVPPKNIRPLENASISPWTYNLSHDSSLFPPLLSEARCLLQGCLNADGLEDLSLESRPIMHHVLVLRRVGSAASGEQLGYHYRLESRLMAVGCTCVQPVVLKQQQQL